LDVPPEETSSPKELPRLFAKPLQNDNSVTSVAGTATFCSTCIKNQHLLTKTLANYLPTPDDPTYDEYETSYPEFRRKLEERYPPLCIRCEPGARKRIEQARYTAKADHLRRMMERSRSRRIASRLGWRSLVVTAGALFFWISALGQLAWNLISIMEDSEGSGADIGMNTASQSLQCAVQFFTHYKTNPGCALTFAPMAFIAIVFGFLSSWWNPKWQHRLQGQHGRLLGLEEYYRVNTAVLLARTGFWVWARDPTILSSISNGQKVIHSMAMFMMMVFTIYTWRRVKVDTTSLVSWQDGPTQLLSQQQYNPPVGLDVVQQPFLSRDSRVEASNVQSFPLSSLKLEPELQIWQAPTPPPRGDPDAMEWEPSQNFQPKPRRPKFNAVPGPSPFHGALPAMPSNRLLHPHRRSQPAPNESIGLPPGFFDKRDRLKNNLRDTALPPMAQPKFFSQWDREADTGLESIFDSVFSLHDCPVVSMTAAQEKGPDEVKQQVESEFISSQKNSDKPLYGIVKVHGRHLAKLFIFVVSSIIWYASRGSSQSVPYTKPVVLCIAGSLSIFDILSGWDTLTGMWDVGNLVCSVAMISGAALLVFQGFKYAGGEANEWYDNAGRYFLFVCGFWEIPRLLHYNSAPSANDESSLTSQTNSWPKSQPLVSVPFEAGNKLEDLSSSGKASLSALRGSQFPASEDSKSRPEQRSSGKPAHSWRASNRRPLYPSRSDSSDSATSQSSVTTTATSTTAGWTTPNLHAHYASEA
jgi:Ima1 N-terminal domain